MCHTVGNVLTPGRRHIYGCVSGCLFRRGPSDFVGCISRRVYDIEFQDEEEALDLYLIYCCLSFQQPYQEDHPSTA